MNVLFQGKPMALAKEPCAVGEKMPDFRVIKNDLQEISLSELKGKKIILSVPSLDTGVCSLEVENFVKYMRGYDEQKHDADVTCISISMDLPFALDRWCQAKENEHVLTASDYKFHEFARSSGVYIEELGLLARAVFVLDEQNVVRYREIVEEITNEPNYDAALNAVS